MASPLFRKQNYLLFLAATINFSLVFAPLAYAANYTRNAYGWAHGAWMTIEKTDPLGGADNYQGVGFTEDIALFGFVLVAVVAAGGFGTLVFFNQRPARKQKWLGILFLGVVLQVGLAVLLRFRLGHYLGEAAPGQLEAHLEAQFWLHAFVLLFAWWAWIAVRREVRAQSAENPAPTPSVS
ncbi:MAG: hypothetical protein AAGN35_04940 [Bacteroidota bacterium]